MQNRRFILYPGLFNQVVRSARRQWLDHHLCFCKREIGSLKRYPINRLSPVFVRCSRIFAIEIAEKILGSFITCTTQCCRLKKLKERGINVPSEHMKKRKIPLVALFVPPGPPMFYCTSAVFPLVIVRVHRRKLLSSVIRQWVACNN